MEKLIGIQNWPQTFPNMPIHGEIVKNRNFFHIEKKKIQEKN